jgi:molybdenum cofactor synthesis domain-containing protein
MPINGCLPGMSDRRIFHKLLDIDEVEKELSRYIRFEPLGVEYVELINSYGRVLAEDIYSPIDHPPFDRSMVDGYAIRSIDVAGADDLHPVELRVKGSIPVGVHPDISVGEGKAVEIATGAMIPRGADSVVMVEYTRRKGDRVLVYRSTYPGENISTSGSDISVGDLVLLKGTILTEREIGLLAGLGFKRVKVYKQPRIAVYSTGNEVIEPGDRLQPGKVYDVNGYLVTNLLRSIGAYVEYKGLLPDDYDIVYETLSRDLERYDILITSGGTSAGLGDLIYRVFDNLGEPGVVIHGLKIKPGKPTVFAIARNKLLIGLPGFPLSCYMVTHRIVKPLIEKFTGYRSRGRGWVNARIPVRIRKPLGKTWFISADIGIIGYSGNSFFNFSVLSLAVGMSHLFAAIKIGFDFTRSAIAN